MQPPEIILSVSDFVAVFNQTIEYAYPLVTIVGELANFRVSKNRWVYFDLKDEQASVKFFGTVYQLPGPLEDGLMVQVSGTPRLHPLYGFSITIQAIRPVGEGSFKRTAALLEAKLRAEGLFDESRKRQLPYPPQRVGLITSGESAAYHDFIKVMNERWGGVAIELADVQVQGDAAPAQLIAALAHFNSHEEPVDVVVITRGGGSAEDLAAFNHEQLTRAVATSRIPTLVAIGHEIDISLAELAADQRASTPSNAAQLLVPDKRHELLQLRSVPKTLGQALESVAKQGEVYVADSIERLSRATEQFMRDTENGLILHRQLLEALSPALALRRGYAIVRSSSRVVRSAKSVKSGQKLSIQLRDGTITSTVDNS
jgi:exodeoxyribonuclease VII large subunit